jgi:hypothetical protein
VTAAADRWVRPAISDRVSGPWDSTVVKIWEAAGVWAGNASVREVERMAGTYGPYFLLSMKETGFR